MPIEARVSESSPPITPSFPWGELSKARKLRSGIHHMPFKRKVKHLQRHKFVPAPKELSEVERFAMEVCPSCGWRGLGYYRFWHPAMFFINARAKRGVYCPDEKRTIRAFSVCDGCGYWREVT